MNIYLITSYISLLIWIYLLLIHGRAKITDKNVFWLSNIMFEKHIKEIKKEKNNDKVCVIIPARNEEKTINKTLSSIKNQSYKNIDIIVINDNSSDRTSNIVNQFKQGFKKIILLNGKNLPSNWVGKTWALKQGVDYANKKNFSYYIFMDSDIVIKKDVIQNIISFIKEKNFLMVSLMAKLNCSSKWERVLIPAFIYFFQKLYPFNLVNTFDSKISAAAGGFILCRASIFQKENQYNKIKNKLIDDCNLAKLLKKNGKIWLGLTNQVLSKRKYKNVGDVWKMVSRTAFEQLGHSFLLVFITVIGLFIIYLFPCIVIFTSAFIFEFYKFNTEILIINIISLIAMNIIYYPTIRFYRLKIYYVFTLPFSALLYVMMTLSSALNHLSNTGNNWKGRRY